MILAVPGTFTICMLLTSLFAAAGAQESPAPAPGETVSMTAQARGTFEVTLTRQPADDFADGQVMGRMTIEKRFHGDLEGTSRGQMLTGMTSVSSSAGYVAIEHVSGSLSGRRGTFLLQHSGTMTRGAQQLVVSIIPDSGTDELAGIAGTMMIDLSGGAHAYVLDYALPAAPDQR